MGGCRGGEGGELLSNSKLLRNAGGASGHRAGGIVGVTVGAGGGAAAAVALISAFAVKNVAVLQAVLSGAKARLGGASLPARGRGNDCGLRLGGLFTPERQTF